MKSSTINIAEGTILQLKGAAKKAVGNVAGSPGLEAEGRVEIVEGNLQEKIGKIQKIVED